MISVWDFTAETRLREIQVYQNKAVRSIFWQEYREPGVDTDFLFRKYRILKISQLVRFDCLMTIFKFRHGLLKCNSSLDIRTFGEVGAGSDRTNTRNVAEARYILPRARLNTLRDSILSRGLSWYNELPTDLLRESNVLSFKSRLKNTFF